MTAAATGDKLALVTAGTAVASASWRGGLGILTVTGLSGTPNFQMQADATWLAVKELGNATPISAIAADAAFTFIAPPCKLRLSAGGGSMNATVIGV